MQKSFFSTNEIKAISLIQPYASMIADGKKKIETRSWSTSYRGKLAIHASQKIDKDACIQFGYDPKDILRGAIVCIAFLVNCVQFPSSLAPPDPYGDFTPGRYGWLLTPIKKLKRPVPAKGALSVWQVDPEIARLLK